MFIWWGNEPSTWLAVESQPTEGWSVAWCPVEIKTNPSQVQDMNRCLTLRKDEERKAWEMCSYPQACTTPSSIHFPRTLFYALSFSGQDEVGVVLPQRAFQSRSGSMREGRTNWLAKKGHVSRSRASSRNVSWEDLYVQVLERVGEGRGPTLRRYKKSWVFGFKCSWDSLGRI